MSRPVRLDLMGGQGAKHLRDFEIHNGIITGGSLSNKKTNDFTKLFQACLEIYSNYPFQAGTIYCNATYDKFLCWPPTPAGTMAHQHCPPARLSDTTHEAFRRCGGEGLWLGKKANESSLIGWTNYTPCFPTQVQDLLVKVYEDENQAQMKFQIAQYTRYMEIVGFSVSFIALLMSLFIFTHFRSLRNSRTRIHFNLFLAMTVEVIVRLIVYIDQEFIRSPQSVQNNVKGIDNMPYICEACYVLLEYAISSMFMWMFVEGLYLHNVVTANVLREQISLRLYCAIGWGLPLIVTAFWATINAFYYEQEEVKRCWYGYNFLSEYWIVQGPRLAVILINLIFLLNIMRVLIVKLSRTENSEIKKVRKAVRAALVLLPLLGITNILNMTEAPLDGSVWKFALWCYSTHFLRSFQGFFIAFIYCFMNGEVRQVLSKAYADWRAMRSDDLRHRQSRANRNNEPTSSWFQLTPLAWIRPAATAPANNDGEPGDNPPSTSTRRRLCAEQDSQDCLDDQIIKLDADTNVTDNV